MIARCFGYPSLRIGLFLLAVVSLAGCSVSQTGTLPPEAPDSNSGADGADNAGETDGGGQETTGAWQPAGFSGGGLFTKVALDPIDATTVYVASDVSGVYRSDDGGETWSAKSAGLLSHAIADFIVDPADHNRVWATTALGLFRSDDRAEHWESVNSELAAYILAAFQSITVSNDGQTILATTHRTAEDELFENGYRTAALTGALVRSADGGANWSAVSDFPAVYPDGTRFPAVQFDPYHEDVAFLAVSGFGILRSADGGLTWGDYSDGLPADASDLAWRSLAFSSTSVFAGATHVDPTAEGEPRLFASDSTTPDWTSIVGDLPPEDETSVSQNSVVVRASSSGDDVYLAYAGWPSLFYASDDRGANWQPTTVQRGVTYTFDAAAAPFQNSWDPFNDFISLALDPVDPDRLFATNWVTVWRSADGGATWQESVRGTQNTVCTDILFTGSEFLATHMDTILQRSANPTDSWSEALPQDGSPNDLAHGWGLARSVDGTLYVGVSTATGGPRVYRSTDNGDTWVDRSPSFGSSGDSLVDAFTELVLTADPTAAATVYAVNRLAAGGIYRSADSGESWTKLPSQPASGDNTELEQFTSLAVDPDSSQRLYAGTYWDGVWYSTDGGASWQLSNAGGAATEGAYVEEVVALLNGVVWIAAENGVYKSTDGGENYTLSLGANADLAEFEYFVAIAANPADHDEVFAASAQSYPVYSLNGSVWHTTDGGANWTSITDGLLHKRVLTLEYADGYIYAGTEGANVFRRKIQ